ncbi:DUF4604 domain-containing protein [Aspergillus saccharolyticus JOP 1030-1]|uniref:DUF4604 domain-containing protein n=1 Tax=Aspergillus saccharolyticus JOP 1030-1 TaxID=1450539 RepID=A0A318Z9H9_9EURO|nr:hypothetical protein BP01DRAFT_361486 [Aspergillus saccharolyticus JOP 1030-1]PYH40200.1 hypothetical protein BP01DRAFT_361486 [Aspergillus saccharolyticus JOP 1030-1]
MSFKSKNLAYEAKEPAFLQRLRNQYGDNSGRLERPVARARKPREEHDDDGPTYVDEESNDIISKEEYEALVRGNKSTEDGDHPEKDQDKFAEPAGEGSKSGAEGEAEASVSKQNIAEIGGPRKRKQAKVIGEDAPAAESEEKTNTKKKDSGVRKAKQKKIKLSFDDDDS